MGLQAAFRKPPNMAFFGVLRIFKIADFHPHSLKILSDVNETLLYHFPAIYDRGGTLDPYIWKYRLPCREISVLKKLRSYVTPY